MLFSIITLAVLAGSVLGDHFEDEEPCARRILVAFSGYRYLAIIDRDAADDVNKFTPTTNLRNPFAVAVDQQNGFVFFTDKARRTIWRKSFKTGDTRSEIIKTLNQDSEPEGITVDASARRLFYTDSGNQLIAVMDYDGENHDVILTSTQNLDKPGAILVHPDTRTMFYTDRGANPHISKANYNGTNVVVLQDSDLSSPNGLAADFANDTLYWCDSEVDTISSMNLDGEDKQVLFGGTSQDFHPFAMIFVHDELLVSEWNQSGIFSLDLNDTSVLTPIHKYVFDSTPHGMAEICLPTSYLSTTTERTDSGASGQDDSSSSESTESSCSRHGGQSVHIFIMVALMVSGVLRHQQ